MSVCPLCKSATPKAGCPSCGSAAADGWGDDDSGGLGGGLDLARGGSLTSSGTNSPSAYSGGGMSFGDDDPFADDAGGGALELDLPSSHSAHSPRSIPAAQQTSTSQAPLSAAGDGGRAVVPDLVLPGPKTTPSSASLRAVVPPTHPSSSSLRAVRSEPSLPPQSARPQHVPVESAPALPNASLPPQSQPQLQVTPAAPNPAAIIGRYPPTPSKIWQAPIYAMQVLWRHFELRQDLASLRKRRSPDVPLYERALGAHDSKMFTLGLVLTCAALTVGLFVFLLPVILRFVRDPS
jgi:hypothetical protein